MAVQGESVEEQASSRDSRPALILAACGSDSIFPTSPLKVDQEFVLCDTLGLEFPYFQSWISG